VRLATFGIEWALDWRKTGDSNRQTGFGAQVQLLYIKRIFTMDLSVLKSWIEQLPTPLFSSRVTLGPSKLQGQGIHAAAHNCAGEILVIDRGIEVPVEVMRLAEKLLNHQNNLCIGWRRYLLDAPINGGAYVNHSCDPNAGLANDRTLVAIRDIPLGDEIFVDYGTFETVEGWEMQCSCGTSLCRGRVTGKDHENPELRARLGKWFSPYLKEHWNILN